MSGATSWPALREAIRAAVLDSGEPGRAPERGLLLACARRAPAVERDEAGSPLDWDYLLHWAGRHGLLPLLQRCVAAGRVVAPREAGERLARRATWHLAENLRLTGALRALADAFRARGIPCVAYKGPVLAQQAYGGPALRQISDLDLVVPEADLAAADALLRERGFRPEFELTPRGARAFARWEYHRAYEDEARALRVELHWRFAPERYGFPLTGERVWANHVTVELGGTGFAAPGAVDLVLLLCVHGARHHWERLEWIAALAECLRALDASGFHAALRLAHEMHARRLLLLGLALAAALFGAPLPPPLADEAAADPAVRRLAVQASARMFAARGDSSEIGEKPAAFLFNLRAKDSAADRLRFALRFLTTPTEDYWYAVALPDRLFPLYRAIRPVRLAAQYAVSRLRR